jgi:hypothetical protein
VKWVSQEQERDREKEGGQEDRLRVAPAAFSVAETTTCNMRQHR